MKARLAVFAIVLLIGAQCHGYPISLFQDMDTFLRRAKDIVVAKCVEPLDNHGFHEGLTAAQVEVVLVLKGDRPRGTLRVVTGEKLEPGKTYMLTNTGGLIGDIDFLALAELSVVPVPANFDLKGLQGKSTKESVQRLLARHLYEIERKMAPLLKEQDLLEKSLSDRTDDVFQSHGNLHLAEPRQIVTGGSKASRSLEIDSKSLQWSHARPGESGYVYYGSESRWEFARSDYRNIKDFEGKPLRIKFFGQYSPGAADNALPVKVGQIILARRVDDPQTVYIIKFESQDATEELVTVQCVTVKAVGKN